MLANVGVDSRDICSATGHRNVESLKSYVKEPNLAQRASMSDMLHLFGKNEESDLQVANVSNASQVAVTHASSTVSVAGGSGVLSGANFYGSTTVNIQVNKTD